MFIKLTILNNQTDDEKIILPDGRMVSYRLAGGVISATKTGTCQGA
jgi:hypothetical protein